METRYPKSYRVRSKVPMFFRIGAILALAVALIVVIVGFYRERSNAAFNLKSEHTQLATDVVSEVSGYERLETIDGVNKYFIKADHAKTFSDNHLELQNVYLEVYGTEPAETDRMQSDSALYIPEEDKNFTAYLKGNVQIETSEALKINTDNLVYMRKTEVAESDDTVSFERNKIRGKSFGAVLKLGEKRLDLLRDVEIEMFDSPELARSNVRYARLAAGSASVDQIANKIDLTTNVAIDLTAKERNSEIKASRALVKLSGVDANNKEAETFELFDRVHVTVAEPGKSSTLIESGYALFEKDADRYKLTDDVKITSSANEKPTEIRADEAVYEQTAGRVALTGGAEIIQAGVKLAGDALTAVLFPNKRVRDAVIRGNSSVHQQTPERTLKVAAPELNAAFNDSSQIKDANAIGQSSVEIIPVTNSGYTNVMAEAARGIGLVFKREGLLETLKTDGRTSIQLNVPNGRADAANKRIVADTVKTLFAPNGKDISKAEAAGNAELYIEPLTANRKNYKTTVKSSRFDCEFFPTGNNAQACIAGKSVKASRVPTVALEGRGTQNISSDELIASFNQQTGDVEILDAKGNARFTELDRNGLANQMTFTQADEVVRLRGGEPTAWDSRGRAKAREIDLDTRNNKSSLRGGVSTTYYSQRQIKNSTPFGSSEKPVFLTADAAEFDHAAETAVYTGNARGWQENNYVRGNRLTLDQVHGKLGVEGSVQTHISNIKVKQKASTVTSASAGSMAFDREKRLLQYRSAVDIRQGADRITAESADIYLNDKNEVSRTIVEKNVAITQPNRKASGEWAEYSAETEVAVLRGHPASVSDRENGSSQGEQLTFSMRENRVSVQGSLKPAATGRTRSVYKIKDLK